MLFSPKCDACRVRQVPRYDCTSLILPVSSSAFAGHPVFICKSVHLPNQLPARPQPPNLTNLPPPGVEHSLGFGHWPEPWVESKEAKTEDTGSFLDAAVEHEGQRARP